MQDKNSKSLFGIDINEYTQDVDFNTLQTQIDFLYLRSSGSGSGRFRVDRKFLEFAKKAREYNIPVGAYHFGVPSYDLNTADRQCDDFISVLMQGFGSHDYGDLFPVIDIETPTEKAISTEALINWIDRFRKRFEKKTRRRLMLYTGAFFIDLYDNFYVPGRGYPLKNMPLWIAMYTAIKGNPPFPKDQGGWTRWRIWQFSEAQSVRGVGSLVDANWGPNNIELLMQPGFVENLFITKKNNQLIIIWNRNQDIDLLGYNIFENNYWIGTVDSEDTEFVIDISELPVPLNRTVTISIEAFDYDGETSKTRAKVTI